MRVHPVAPSVALALVLAAALGAASSAPATAQDGESDNRWLTERRVVNFGHGGGQHEAPANTLFAFETALDRGATALEMDLHITRDGHVVTIHDSTVDRTTDGVGCVATMTLAEVQSLDAAVDFVPGRGPVGDLEDDAYPYRGIATGEVDPPEGFAASDFTVATLESVFEAQPDALMVIELKPTEVYGDHDCPAEVAALPEDERPSLPAEVARLIEAHDMGDRVLVASFVDGLMAEFKAAAPDVDTSFPVGEAVAVYTAYLAGEAPPNPSGHEALQVPLEFGGITITRELVEYARGHGIAVHFWTINDLEVATELLEWGADGIITDVPGDLQVLLDQRGVGLPSGSADDGTTTTAAAAEPDGPTAVIPAAATSGTSTLVVVAVLVVVAGVVAVVVARRRSGGLG